MKLLLCLIFLFSSTMAFSQAIGRFLPPEYQNQNNIFTKNKKTFSKKKKKRSFKKARRTRRYTRAKTIGDKKRRPKLKKSTSSSSVSTAPNFNPSVPGGVAPVASISAQAPKKPTFRKYTERLNFNYFAQYLGPSLSSDYQTGATYNRFKTGQDYKGDQLDATASHQMFHSITLGYQLAKDYNLSFGYTFQDDLNSDIKYRSKNEDGSYSEFIRLKGVSDNNKRMNLFVSNIYSNKYFTINANNFFEFASTFNSEGNDMDYGLGFQPSINFNTGIRGFYTGVTSSIQRNYFKQQEFFQKCGDADCKYPTRYQTLLAEVGAYANYSLSDYIMLRSSIAFDWDQRGNQVETFSEFNKNMDDVGRIGIDVNIDYGVTAGTFLEFALENAALDRSAIGATLNVNLF